MDLIAGVVDQSTVVRAMTGSGPLSGKVAADFTIWFRRGGAKVLIALHDLGAVDDAHSDGGIIEIDDGWYRLDLPDAAVAGGVASVAIGGSVDGGVVLSAPIGLTALAEVTVSAAAPALTAITSGGTITIHRGDRTVIQLTGLGDLSGRSGEKLWFTAKTSTRYSDSQALLQVTETTGMMVVAAATTGFVAGDGAITIDDESTGDITITILHDATKSLPRTSDGVWDVQMIRSDGEPVTLTRGRFVVNEDVSVSID